ncbi:MAG: helix-turn-helix transcriptional regulator [Dissulfurispiraceae bacterium]
MSYKFDSLISILKKLDQREKVTVQSLTHDLEVSERTAYRYILTLQVAGFPITYNREKQSYVFFEDFSLGKPNLTLEETLALALSKNLLKSFGQTMANSINSIEDKLAVKKAEIPKHIIFSTEMIPPSVETYLRAIHQAIGNFQRIDLTYKSLYADEKTCRKVEPYYLFYEESLWHLRAYCYLREDFRTFSLDRIESLTVLDEYFVPKRISSEELSSSFGPFIDGDPVEVVLRFDPDIKQYIIRKKWHQSQKTKELADGKLEVRFLVNGIEGIRYWIYRWIPDVEVLKPKELKALFKSDIQKAAKKLK